MERDYPYALRHFQGLRSEYLTDGPNGSKILRQELTFKQATMFWKCSMVVMMILPLKDFAPLLINETYNSLKALKGGPDDEVLMERYREEQIEAYRNIGDQVLSSLYDDDCRRYIQNVDSLSKLFDEEDARVFELRKDSKVAGLVAGFIEADNRLIKLRGELWVHHEKRSKANATKRYIANDLMGFTPTK
ncbi:MAG: hypothetical protein Q9224_004071 [Gallowayella concinna]